MHLSGLLHVPPGSVAMYMHAAYMHVAMQDSLLDLLCHLPSFFNLDVPAMEVLVKEQVILLQVSVSKPVLHSSCCDVL